MIISINSGQALNKIQHSSLIKTSINLEIELNNFKYGTNIKADIQAIGIESPEIKPPL